MLVNAKGRTLYVFMKDKHSRVTCTGTCAKYWPPLKWKRLRQADGRRAPRRAPCSAWDKDPAGGKVVTYNHWPLYTYAGDSAAGQANGLEPERERRQVVRHLALGQGREAQDLVRRHRRNHHGSGGWG